MSRGAATEVLLVKLPRPMPGCVPTLPALRSPDAPRCRHLQLKPPARGSPPPPPPATVCSPAEPAQGPSFALQGPPAVQQSAPSVPLLPPSLCPPPSQHQTSFCAMHASFRIARPPLGVSRGLLQYCRALTWGAFSYSVRTAPIITLFIPGTPLKPTPMQKRA